MTWLIETLKINISTFATTKTWPEPLHPTQTENQMKNKYIKKMTTRESKSFAASIVKTLGKKKGNNQAHICFTD